MRGKLMSTALYLLGHDAIVKPIVKPIARKRRYFDLIVFHLISSVAVYSCTRFKLYRLDAKTGNLGWGKILS